MVPLRERRGSKKRALPNFTAVRVMGALAGTFTVGAPGGRTKWNGASNGVTTNGSLRQLRNKPATTRQNKNLWNGPFTAH